jgi:hypothetical protein
MLVNMVMLVVHFFHYQAHVLERGKAEFPIQRATVALTPTRHPRAGGDPAWARQQLASRLRGNDMIGFSNYQRTPHQRASFIIAIRSHTATTILGQGGVLARISHHGGTEDMEKYYYK